MTRITGTILLIAALSTVMAAGVMPSSAQAETATASTTLVTQKGDRGKPNPRLAAILASIAAESNG